MKTEPDNGAGDPADAARSWVRRCAHGLSAAERADFRAWLAADPGHARALARENRDGVDCDWAWQNGAVDEVLVGVAARVRRQRNRRAVFAGVAALLVTSAFVWNLDRSTAPHMAAVSPATLVVVRPAIQTLPDGSVVELKDDAQISVDFSTAVRAVFLSRGTAYFQVAKDVNRPFVVSAAGLAVQAVGTAFAVELEHNELKVLVAEGKVRVDAAHQAPAPRPALSEPLVALGAVSTAAFPLAPGGAAAAPTSRSVASSELQQRLGWRMPKLEFTRTPLREVVAQMNQHNVRKFVLADESVGDVRVSGVLRADKMDTLADTLQTDFGLETERRDDAIVVRQAR